MGVYLIEARGVGGGGEAVQATLVHICGGQDVKMFFNVPKKGLERGRPIETSDSVRGFFIS